MLFTNIGQLMHQISTYRSLLCDGTSSLIKKSFFGFAFSLENLVMFAQLGQMGKTVLDLGPDHGSMVCK